MDAVSEHVVDEAMEAFGMNFVDTPNLQNVNEQASIKHDVVQSGGEFINL